VRFDDHQDSAAAGEDNSGGGDADSALLADIGATRARFALTRLSAGEPGFENAAALDSHGFPSLAAAASAYLDKHHAGRRPRIAAFAVASPIMGDRVRFTNLPWDFSIAELRHDLGLTRLDVVNDFAAVSRAVPALTASDLLQLGGGAPVAGAPVAALGPGTGLGVSGLVPFGGHWRVLPTEGGHVSVAAEDDREAAIIAALRHAFGHVSAERLLSGPGLRNLYRAMRELDGQKPESLGPTDITDRGLAGADPACVEALEVFCALLGGFAGNLALTLGATGGVYLAGGVAQGLAGFLPKSRFRERFEAKGRMGAYLEPIPVFLITHPYPAFVGLMAGLREVG
jgi:glucokinase